MLMQAGFCLSLFPVIRAKVVGQQEVDAGNNVYGATIKRLKYDIKQIKVNRDKAILYIIFMSV